MNYNKQTLVELFASQSDKRFLEAKPELLDFYVKLLNFDYYYDRSDDGSVWRAGCEEEDEIKAKFEELAEIKHPHLHTFTRLFANKGDESLSKGNIYRDYLNQVYSSKRSVVRFLQTLDQRGFTATDLKRMIRVMLFIERLMKVKPDFMDFEPEKPSLVWTKILGSINVGKLYQNKVAVNDLTQRVISVQATEVSHVDFQVINRLTSTIGMEQTNYFNLDEEESTYVYIGNYYFAVSKEPRFTLPKVPVNHSILSRLRVMIDRSREHFQVNDERGE